MPYIVPYIGKVCGTIHKERIRKYIEICKENDHRFVEIEKRPCSLGMSLIGDIFFEYG